MEWKSFAYFEKFRIGLLHSIHLAKLHLGCCDLCGQRCQTFPLLCDTCEADLLVVDMSLCDGDLLNYPDVYRCLRQPLFDRLVTVCAYEWPLMQWIHQLKFHRRYEVINLLSRLMVNQLNHANNLQTFSAHTVVIAVPMHWFKQKRRHANHAALLAHGIAQLTGFTLNLSLVLRVKGGKAQRGLTGAQRRKNLRGAFQLNLHHQRLPEQVIIVDDVVTTGTTANSISRLLKQHGVKHITVLAAALAI